jgi:hypothetical protein
MLSSEGQFNSDEAEGLHVAMEEMLSDMEKRAREKTREFLEHEIWLISELGDLPNATINSIGRMWIDTCAKELDRRSVELSSILAGEEFDNMFVIVMKAVK